MREYSDKKIINCAIHWIESSFSNNKLKQLTKLYIEHKFNKGLNLSKLTKLHYIAYRNNVNEQELIELQTITELILLATDIQDDIQDNDSLDNPWTNIHINENLNIILGLFTIAFQKICHLDSSTYKKNFLIEIVQSKIITAINGQQTDLDNKIQNEEDYLNLAMSKSGSLIFIANILGAGNLMQHEANLILKYSNYLGVVAQVRNDVFDLINIEKKNDFVDKKKTLPILYYLHIDDPRFQNIKNYFSGDIPYEKLQDTERKMLIHTLQNGGAILYCKIIEQIYQDKFISCVNSLKIKEQHKELIKKINI